MRISKKILIGFFILLLFAALGCYSLYVGSQHVPEFYQQAIEADPEEQRIASTEMFNSTAALVRDASREGRWEATFTIEQINGWLAVDLVENYPNLLSIRSLLLMLRSSWIYLGDLERNPLRQYCSPKVRDLPH